MEIIKIISEHKYFKRGQHPKGGHKRVMAIVKNNGRVETKHVEIPR